jgi:hypothetical protein
LFGDGSWSLVLKPDSWLLRFTVITMLLDEYGAPLPPAETTDLLNQVHGELTFEAAYLEGGAPLRASFETSSQDAVTAAFPLPPGEEPGSLKLSILSTRSGGTGMKTQPLAADETLVLVKVDPDGKIRVVTNGLTETVRGADRAILDRLARLT